MTYLSYLSTIDDRCPVFNGSKLRKDFKIYESWPHTSVSRNSFEPETSQVP